ncbi:MAG: hypothetical protein ACFFAS_02050 [Promethearchaeota archaeon]
MELKEIDTFNHILSRLTKQSVDILLKTGQSISCKIIRTTGKCTHIERTDSKSFYDMIIRTEDIVAIEKKVR